MFQNDIGNKKIPLNRRNIWFILNTVSCSFSAHMPERRFFTMHRYQHVLSPIKVGNLMLKTRLTSSAGAHYSQELADRAANGASVIYISHIMLDTKLLAAVASPNGAMGPGGPRMTDREKADFLAIQACLEKIHNMGSYAITMPMGNMPRRPGEGPGGPKDNRAPGAGPESEGGGGGDMRYDPNDPEKQLYAEREGVMGHDIGWITEEGIWDYINSTVENAVNLKLFGFDMLSLHCAYHNNIADEFWSTKCNHRTDDWGGSREKRARLILTLFRKLREALGPDFPLEIILTAEGIGHSYEDTLWLIEALGTDVDVVHIRTDYKDTQHPIGYTVTKEMPSPNLEITRKLKHELVSRGCKTLIQASAGFCDPDLMERTIAQGDADLIAIHRFWHADPDFLQKLYEDRGEDVIPCVKCNRCGQCPVNPAEVYDAATRASLIKPVTKKKRVAVIGGGPGGMYAANLLGQRGHHVVLYEKESALGGQLRHAGMVHFKWPMAAYITWLENQLRKQENITLKLGVEASPEMIAREGYDEVVVAIGPRFRALNIPGLTPENSCNVLEAYENYESLPDRVAVIGGSETGTEMGIFLAEQGRHVNVLTRQGMLCPETPHSHYVIMIMDYFKSIPEFSYTTFVKQYVKYENGALYYLDKQGNPQTTEADYVVVCAGSEALQEKAMAYHGCANRVHYIGDCTKQGNVHEATLAAWRAANQI